MGADGVAGGLHHHCEWTGHVPVWTVVVVVVLLLLLLCCCFVVAVVVVAVVVVTRDAGSICVAAIAVTVTR